MPWSTYGEAGGTYGDSAAGFGGNTRAAARLWGDSTYGDGFYGDSAVWSQLGNVVGPAGDSDFAYFPPVSAPLIYTSGWNPYPGFQEPRVYRDRQGYCHLSGVFQGPTSFTSGVIPATLPPLFWPVNRVMHPVIVGDPITWSRLDI